MANLFLQLAIILSGLSISPDPVSCQNPSLLGQYVEGSNVVQICYDNIKKSKFTADVVIRHELIHVIHANLGFHRGEDKTILPYELLSWSTRHFINQDEAMAIIQVYDEGVINQEFEARLGQNLPNGIVALGLIYSSVIDSLSN